MTRAMVVALLVLAPAAGRGDDERRPQGPPGTVTLPLGDYDRLVDRAARPPKRPEPPPLPAVLARAEIRLRVAADSARGTFTLDGEVFRTGPTKIPLLSGATLLEARLAGKALPLLLEGGAHAAVVTGPGVFSIALDWGAPVAAEPGRASFVLPVPSAGSARATLELPGEQADVHLAPGLITRRTAAGGKTVVEATLDPGSRARFSWSARESATPTPREARFLSDVRTLVTVGEAELRMATLVDVSVLQGEPQRFDVRLPAGFEVTGATGSSLEKTEERSGVLTLVVRDAARNRHQFLVSLERASAGGSFDAQAPLPSVDGAQRETGEAAVEGVGTLELTATEGDGMRRMDVREASDALRGLARQPLLAAFRYHRRAGDLPHLDLGVKRFPDASVLAAVAERAVVTTLVTTEGRTLTEVALTVRNQAQPFLKVALPTGATLLSADVAGEGVKPVKGDDGTRVPLLRPGFRPNGPYAVSFVYLQPGVAFGKKGDAQLGLPRMDVPVSLLEWELFLPDRYKVRDFGGNAFPSAFSGVRLGSISTVGPSGSGQILGRVTDESGAALAGATVNVRLPGGIRSAVTDGNGYYGLYGLPSGTLSVEAELSGFSTVRRTLSILGTTSAQADFRLRVGTVQETVTVTAEAPSPMAQSSGTYTINEPRDSATGYRDDRRPRKQEEEAQVAPSANVYNLQRRVAGVLPVRVDIPRAGASYRFVRPLVLDEETTVRFRYKTR